MNSKRVSLAAVCAIAAACITPPPPPVTTVAHTISIVEVTPGNTVTATEAVSVKVKTPSDHPKWGLYVDGALKLAGDTDTLAAGTLAPGQHILRAALHQDDAKEVEPPVRADTIVLVTGAEKISIIKVGSTATPSNFTGAVTIPYNAFAVTAFVENAALGPTTWTIKVDNAECKAGIATSSWTVKNPACVPFDTAADDCSGTPCDKHKIKAFLDGTSATSAELDLWVLRPTISIAALDPSPAGDDVATPNSTDTYATSTKVKITAGAAGNFGSIVAKPDPATNELGKGHFKYKLDGADATAGETEATSFTYSSLALGDHTLSVQLVQNDGTAIPATASVKIDAIRPAGPFTAKAFLTVWQESPWYTTWSGDSASASFMVNAAEDSIDWTVTTDTIINYTAAHVHGPGKAGENAGVMYTLAANAGTLNSTTPLSGSGTTFATGVTTAQFLDAIATGNAYANIHTTAYPAGFIRGQLGAVEMKSTLTAKQVDSDSSATGSGTATFTLNPEQTQITWLLTWSGLSNSNEAKSAWLESMTGDTLFYLIQTPDTTGSATGTLDSDDLEDISDFKQALDRLVAGGAHVNIEAGSNFPEIRGHIGATSVRANLSGSGGLNGATGWGHFRLNASQDKIAWSMAIRKNDGTDPLAATMSHFHSPRPSGGILLDIFTTATNFTVDANTGPVPVTGNISTVSADALKKILNRETYVNVHTSGNDTVSGDANPYDPWD